MFLSGTMPNEPQRLTASVRNFAFLNADLVKIIHGIYFSLIHVCSHSEVEVQEFGNDGVRNLAALPQTEGLLEFRDGDGCF